MDVCPLTFELQTFENVRMMRTRSISPMLLALLLLGFSVVATACDADTKTNSAATGPNAPSDTDSSRHTEQSYDVTGIVRTVTPDGSHLVVEHDAIADLMHAMTMPFAVSDTASVDHVAAGDEVRFVLTRSADGMSIHSITRNP